MEGPSLVILKEELQPFLGKKVLNVEGNTTQPKESLRNLILKEIKTWGKNVFLFFGGGTTKSKQKSIVVKIHFLLFGSYRINEAKENRVPRLKLTFKNGSLFLYSCSIKFGARGFWRALDKKVDLMSPKWNKDHVVDLMKKQTNTKLCDLFLDQNIFAGSGNIIKNEVLFNLRLHPLTLLKQIKQESWPVLANAVRSYCFDFYKWKKAYELRKHWQVYRQKKCPVCQGQLVKENLGKYKRRNFHCPVCQAKKTNPVAKTISMPASNKYIFGIVP
jgi:endonuclease-8